MFNTLIRPNTNTTLRTSGQPVVCTGSTATSTMCALKKMCMKKSISYSAAFLWNSLPDLSLAKETNISLNQFKFILDRN